MDWDDLRYLLAVSRRKTLAGAARELGVTKATASRRLAALEEALGTPLFDRKPGGLTLTPAGTDALASAQGMEDLVARLEEHAQASDARVRGRVKLTAPPWLADRLLLPALPELRALHPELEVELLGGNAMMDLVRREADLALRNVKPEQSTLVSRRVATLGGCVYASRLYLERHGLPAARAALGGHDVLVYATHSGMPGFEWLRDTPHGGTVAFRANDPVALVSAATAGLGLAAVPCLLGDPEPSLARVETLGFSRCDMYLVTHEQIRRAPRIRVVGDFVAAVLQKNRRLLEG